jgi:hypothetical protein
MPGVTGNREQLAESMKWKELNDIPQGEGK